MEERTGYFILIVFLLIYWCLCLSLSWCFFHMVLLVGLLSMNMAFPVHNHLLFGHRLVLPVLSILNTLSIVNMGMVMLLFW